MSTEPDYLGTPKSEVIDSLKRAVAFVKKLNLGPETNKELKNWLATKPYDKIAAAQTRVELSQAMQESGARSQFIRLSDVFAHHAMADKNNKGPRALYTELSAWGAFSGMVTADYRKTDEEQDRHLVTELAKIAQTQPAQRRLAAILQEASKVKKTSTDKYEIAQAKRVSAMGDRILNALVQGSDIPDMFDDAELHERHMLKEVLHMMSGLETQRDKISGHGPYQRFGVVIPGAGKGQTFDAMQKAAAPIQNAFFKALEPFYETDEVQMTAIGGITQDFSKCGLLFTGSRAAAQAVANALPAETVIDYEGNVVKPQGPKAAPKGPAPQP